jgi:hypothetical protein
LVRDAVDAEVPLTNGSDADGEVVRSWHPDAGVKLLRSERFSGVTEATKPGLRGDYEGNR